MISFLYQLYPYPLHLYRDPCPNRRNHRVSSVTLSENPPPCSTAATEFFSRSAFLPSSRDADLFPPTLSPSSPIFGYLQCVAEHGEPSLVPSWISKGLKGKITQKSLDALATSYAAASGRFVGEFLVRTSKAVTLFTGGHKVNALPESAMATFNSRIDFSQTRALPLLLRPFSLYVAELLPCRFFSRS